MRLHRYTSMSEQSGWLSWKQNAWPGPTSQVTHIVTTSNRADYLGRTLVRTVAYDTATSALLLTMVGRCKLTPVLKAPDYSICLLRCGRAKLISSCRDNACTNTLYIYLPECRQWALNGYWYVRLLVCLVILVNSLQVMGPPRFHCASFAFNFNLRPYTAVGNDGQAAGGIPATLGFEWLPSPEVVEKAEEA